MIFLNFVNVTKSMVNSFLVYFSSSPLKVMLINATIPSHLLPSFPWELHQAFDRYNYQYVCKSAGTGSPRVNFVIIFIMFVKSLHFEERSTNFIRSQRGFRKVKVP